MRKMEFKMERTGLLEVGDILPVTEGKLPNSYYYTLGRAYAMSANYKYNERLQSREGKVIDVREKVKISDNASVGAYYFRSAAEYIRIYEEYYKNDSNIEKGEKYIAPMYNQLIKENKDVRITTIPFEAVKCLGTPEELEIFIKS